MHFECWSKEVSTKKLRQGFWLIWHASLWVIWKARNDIIFNNGTFDVEEVVENIKVLSWSVREVFYFLPFLFLCFGAGNFVLVC